MKIKWKFEEEQEDFDKQGNLRNYYKDSEPWKKREKPNMFYQILMVTLVLFVCAVIIVVGFSLGGYDWSQVPGIRVINDIITSRFQ
jgi:hypothetical protein